MDYEKYNNALKKAKMRYNEIKGTDCSEEKFLLDLFPELKESEDEKIRKVLIDYFKKQEECGIKTFFGIPTDNIIAWLEKQGEKKSADKVEPKFKVKFAGNEYNVLEIKEFPGGIIYYGIEDEPNHIDYILPENCEIISGYGVKEKGNSYPTKSAIFSEQNPAWTEKQDEKKVPSVDFKAKDCYVSEVDGNIHNMTYDAADKVKPKFKVAEYVYILDYCSSRVIVAKHDLVEPISELFEQLGLKENQCHYMVSTDILSIEYINF